MNLERVVIPLLSFNRSGGVRSVLGVAGGLAAKNINVRLYAPSYAPVPSSEINPAVELVTVDSGGPARKLRYVFKLISALARERGLFLATGYKTPLYIHLSQLAAGRRARVVSLIQSYEPLTHIRYGTQPAVVKPLLHAVAKIGYRLPAHRIAVSEFVAGRVGTRRISDVINPGIAQEFTALIPRGENEAGAGDNTSDGAGAGKFTAGFFPPVGPVKGIRYAVEAARLLGGAGAGVDFLVYDVDYPTAGLPGYVERYSKRGGPRSIIGFYRACDVFVYPSLAEGFGLPPLEAMACGTPVVVTDSGGVRDYAVDGKNCILVQPGSAQAIAGAIKQIKTDRHNSNIFA